MKLYYVANARMPTEKAHGIQIAKMCEAFIEAGIDIELVVPTRRTVPQSVQAFYVLRVEVPIKRLLVPDLYLLGRIGYRVSSYLFMMQCVAILWWKKLRGERFIVYTVDLDNFSSAALSLVPAPLFSEMHGGKPNTFEQRFLFRGVCGIIAINSIIVEELKKMFPFSRIRYLVEPNGVDADSFHPHEKGEARRILKLPADKKLVLYTGRMFAWKGLEVVRDAAMLSDHNTLWYIVGGTQEAFLEIVPGAPVPHNMIFVGDQTHASIPLWLAAADVLVVLGTKRDTQSYFYTSPMKLFEYMLSERPIVASETPAIRQLVSNAEVLFYEPDNAKDFADKVAYAMSHTSEMSARLIAAEKKGRLFSWKARAERIKQFIVE